VFDQSPDFRVIHLMYSGGVMAQTMAFLRVDNRRVRPVSIMRPARVSSDRRLR
jgi:hypothetical protein